MMHQPVESKMGYKCECGEKFIKETLLFDHILSEENKMTEPKTEEEVTKEAEIVTTEPKSNDKPVKANELATSVGQIAKITSTEMAREMVKKYAVSIVGDQRAQEFFMQLGFLMRKSPQLAQCSPESVFVAMMQCVNLNIMPGTPEQYAAIIPYGKEAQFQLMYQGGMELAYRSGVVKTIKADLVFKEDEFDFDDATNYIHHKKNLTIDRTVAKNIVAAYAVAKLENGETQFIVMSPSEIAKIKRTVKANKPGTPWTDWEEKQVRKTAIKQLLKDLPSSRKDNKFKAAVMWDSMTEGGRKAKVDMETGQIIEGEVVDLSLATKEAINNAKTKEELKDVLQTLDVKEQKMAAPLVNTRLKELV
jgi:recombination protein RecT